MKKLITRAITSGLAFVPVFVFAQDFGRNGVIGLLDAANYLISRALPLIIALTVLVFLWGVFKFAVSTNEDNRKQATGYMIWGIVGLAVMVSVWGIVNLLVRTFNFDNNMAPPPQIPITRTQ